MIALFLFFVILFFVIRGAIRSAIRSTTQPIKEPERPKWRSNHRPTVDPQRTDTWAEDCVAANKDRLIAIDELSGNPNVHS